MVTARGCAWVVLAVLLGWGHGTAAAEVRRAKFWHNQGYTIVEVLKDDLIHVEFGAGAGPGEGEWIRTSPMVAGEYGGPSRYHREGTVLETDVLHVVVTEHGCVDVKTARERRFVTTVCPVSMSNPWKGMSVNPTGVENVYGLGQLFLRRGSADGDWLRHGLFRTDGDFGNHFRDFWGGANPQLQFPMLYATGDGGDRNYGLFLDNVYKQSWDFAGDTWWQVRMHGDEVRFYLLWGDDMLDVRRDYMELTGRPPVPPRKAFGLWMSEFGYDNWGEVDWKLSGLREGGYPVDGFVLDLQWFGGAWQGSADSPMGGLKWDEGNFPRAQEKIAGYREDHIGIITIEESYVATHQQNYGEMRGRGGVARWCDTGREVEFSSWMGWTGMIDWSQPDAGAWWHDRVRKPNLVDAGVLGHWTDLGEPERYDANACYRGVREGKRRHPDVHNLYNLLWHKTIYDGYVRHHTKGSQRPFLLARAGAPGIQRYGAALWSGDIASRLDTLATHMNAAMHMSFVGVDYYGSDVGGFWRKAMYGGDGIPPDTLTSNGWRPYAPEMYMQWFANAAWFDVPLRPHVYNCGFSWFGDAGCPHETSPAWMGEAFHRMSNLWNLRQRYELIPYYYSLAHRAHLNGEPVVSPMALYYPRDRAVREMGHQKLLGRDIVVGVVASHGERARDVYLPSGVWYNYHTFTAVQSRGEWVRGVELADTGVFRLPAFARGGAIIPMMRVDAHTKDAYGHRSDGTRNTELVIRIFASKEETGFTLYEDDGATVASYDAKHRPSYDTRTTAMRQVWTSDVIRVDVAAAQGVYTGDDEIRDTEVQVVCGACRPSAVRVNGRDVAHYSSHEALRGASSGWYFSGGRAVVKIGRGSVRVPQSVEVLV